MKTRRGFVGNSSTSSFLIFGANLSDVPEDQIERIKEEKVEVHSGPYETYIGLSWDDVRDNETGWEFKQRVTHGIKMALEEAGVDEEIIKSLEFETHSEAWYDG